MSESEKQVFNGDIGSILNRDRAILNAIEEGTFYDLDLITKDEKIEFKSTIPIKDIIPKFIIPSSMNKIYNSDITCIEPINLDNLIIKYSKLIGLDGMSYLSTNRMVFYHELSNLLKDNYIISNNLHIDLRIPLIILLKAGHGKLNYQNFIKTTTDNLERMYSEPVSYHPEQFIGKIIVKEHKKDDNEYIPVYGILAGYQVLIDEGKDLLIGKNPIYEESLKYIRYALDPIGSHQLEKKQVNVPYEDQLRYYTAANICILSQPISNINEELLTRGSFRRFAICCPDVEQDERNNARKKITLNSDTVNNIDYLRNEWKEYTKSISGQKYNLIFDCVKTIDDYIDTLLLDSSSYDSGEEYTDSLQFNLKYLIAKMAAIRAIVRQPNNDTVVVTVDDAKGAILDHKPTWRDQLTWINRGLIMTSDKPIGWKDDLHGWIMEGLTKRHEGILQTEIVARYLKKFEGTKAPNTLKQYVYRALKELEKWDMVESIDTGIKNSKKFTLKSVIFNKNIN